MKRAVRHAGFSLIEALVVLAIGGMALAIIFSIGTKAGDTGFSLGRRAMAAADTDLATSDLRTVLRSVLVRPRAGFVVGLDTPMIGATDRLEADVVMERATQCAPQGWSGRLTLSIVPAEGGEALVCEAGTRTSRLALMPGDGARFGYSTDAGQTWMETYTDRPVGTLTEDDIQRSVSLWMRVSSLTGLDVVEASSSGPPARWGRRDVE
jgi:prepilin-type N-terminal cleavage/methylation domain-containing protein